MVTWRTAVGAGAALLLFGSGALAQDAAPGADAEPPAQARVAAEPRPFVFHAPVSIAPAHRAVLLYANVEHAHLVKRALVVYRTTANPTLREVVFERADPGPFVATIPAEDVRPGHVEYTVELETTTGDRWSIFAARSRLHSVLVPDDLTDLRERASAERLGGRRSVTFARGEYVSFGSSSAVVTTTGGTVLRAQHEIRDRYWRIEGGYAHRPLRDVTEFGVRLGVLRGESPVPDVEDEEQFKVGLNYASPWVTLRAANFFHLRGDFLTSVTEVGFSLGGGAAIIAGDPLGSRLTVGFESIRVFGTRFFSRMDVQLGDTVTIAPVVEVTNMPHADRYGVRLLSELQLTTRGGFGIAGQFGYQARDSTRGGAGGGVTVSYAF